jgi:uncharacterized protein YcnI
LVVFGGAEWFGGDIFDAVPEGAFEVPDESGQAPAECFAYSLDFYQDFVVHTALNNLIKYDKTVILNLFQNLFLCLPNVYRS